MSRSADIPHAVEMRGIIKRFPGVLAVDNVDFTLRAGEIHALLGENGAGKSTLMNVLAGLYRPDKGTINIHGRQTNPRSPRDAIEQGIGMVHQNFMLVPSQTVTENILLGLDEPRFLMRLHKYDKQVAELGERFGLEVDPKAKIWQLSVGEQQRVEILKMLYRGTDVLILDEPTAVLAPQEIEELFNILRSMKNQGKSIIFISHKLGEVTSVADSITVLRKGRVAAAGLDAASTSTAELARLMVGREVLFRIEKETRQPGEVVLSVENVHALNDKGLPALNGVSLQVRAGEIVGLAGVAGNGQRELAEAITGLRHCVSGQVTVKGQKVSTGTASDAIRQGVAHVPQDRRGMGSAPNLNLIDNLIMKDYNRPPVGPGWVIKQPVARQRATELKEEYEIMAPSVDTSARLLSGGNLQRLILAREISAQPELLVAVQPTRGLDVGAIEGVQRLLLAQREAGGAILLISEELDELFSLSDRVMVIYEGQIVGELVEEDRETVGLMMTGQKRE
ncbi:MAG: heme ABC transporter ATP-binding protein [Anaerolineaceae bacterium 4572_32.1]|nr:MAG: heme ABC transporter ATP-binding protein [Anaerolineaceae bacterium 4572_32.1]